MNPIPSFRFWSGRKNKCRLCKSKHGLLVPNRMRRWYSGHLFVCSCDSAVSFFDIENSSQVRLVLHVWRALSALRSALDSKASKAALTDSSLAAKRRAEALHVLLFSTKHPSPTRRPAAAAAAAVCVLSYGA